MPFYQMDVNINEDSRVNILSKKLNISKAEACGTLALFWSWAMKKAQNGRIDERTDFDEIAAYVGYEGNGETLMEAMGMSGIINGTTIIGWEKIGIPYFNARARNNSAASRSKSKVTGYPHGYHTVTQPVTGTVTPIDVKDSKDLRLKVKDVKDSNNIAVTGYQTQMNPQVPLGMGERTWYDLNKEFGKEIVDAAVDRIPIGQAYGKNYWKAVCLSVQEEQEAQLRIDEEDKRHNREQLEKSLKFAEEERERAKHYVPCPPDVAATLKKLGVTLG